MDGSFRTCRILHTMSPASRSCLRSFCVLAILFTVELLHAQTPVPLSVKIDQLMAADGVAPPVADAEFLRRVSFDLIGIPPSTEELRAFLADSNPEKRQAAVDRLLEHPRYARHMAEVFDVMLMERRPAKYVTADEWHAYLLKAFRENRPYNVLAKEILSADGTDPNLRPAARFYLDREAEPNLLTRDVGRIFFGRDMQCAQCHDHPLIDDYFQADYQGLFAFFSTGSVFTAPAPDGKAYFAEKAGVDVTFESVFVKGEKHVTGPKLPGMARLDEPVYYPGDEYEVKPAENVRPVPKFSRRVKLAELATSGSNRLFNENIANRLWAHMMGRGLVNPVDLHHPSNPPANPELLKLLGEEFAAMGFDVKAFLRSLTLTQTYQRTIDRPADPLTLSAAAAGAVSAMEQQFQQLQAELKQADEAYAAAEEQWVEARKAADPVRTELEQANAAAVAAMTKFTEAETQLAATQAQLAAKNDIAAALAEAVAKAQAVAQKLPQDQELAQAAQKFVERNQQVAAEIPPLTAAVEQKQAAMKEPTDLVAQTRQAIDAVRAKLQPLTEAAAKLEAPVVMARMKARDLQASVNRMEKQLESLRQLATLKPQHDQIAAATAAVQSAEAGLAQANQAVADYQATVAAHTQKQQAAQQSLQQAAAKSEAARQEQARWRQIAVSVTQALATTQEAAKLLPDDPKLAEAAATLAAKLEELKPGQAAVDKALADAMTAQTAEQAKLDEATKQLQTVMTQMGQYQQLVDAAKQTLQTAQADVETKQAAYNETLSQLDTAWTESFVSLPLKPLTPEQMCWSFLHVTGVLDRYYAAEEAEVNKTAPLSDADKQDPAKVRERALELEQRVYDKLKGVVAAFAGVYAAAGGQPQTDFFATVDQALFAANGGYLNSWVAPAAGNVTERMIQQQDPKVAAEDLYLTFLSRQPTEPEIADVTQYLAARPEEKAACVQELAWALLTSAEFRFNH